jgi:DNA polymerase-3 subunit alpha
VHEQIIDQVVEVRRRRDQGEMSFFDLGPGAGAEGFDHKVEIPETEFGKAERLKEEKEMLGLYVSEHPMMSAERALRRHIDCTLTEFKECREGDLKVVGGVVTALSRKYTKRGDLMATFVLEDLGAAMEVMVFPKTMTGFGHLLEDDAIICVKGRLDLRDDAPKLICMDLTRPELVLDGGPPVRVKVKIGALSRPKVDRLKQLLREHPGECPVYVHLDSPEKTTVFQLADDFLVDSSNGLYAELRILFGADCIA